MDGFNGKMMILYMLCVHMCVVTTQVKGPSENDENIIYIDQTL